MEYSSSFCAEEVYKNVIESGNIKSKAVSLLVNGYIEISSFPSQMAKINKNQMTEDAGKDIRKWEHLFIDARSPNCHSHYGNQC